MPMHFFENRNAADARMFIKQRYRAGESSGRAEEHLNTSSVRRSLFVLKKFLRTNVLKSFGALDADQPSPPAPQPWSWT